MYEEDNADDNENKKDGQCKNISSFEPTGFICLNVTITTVLTTTTQPTGFATVCISSVVVLISMVTREIAGWLVCVWIRSVISIVLVLAHKRLEMNTGPAVGKIVSITAMSVAVAIIH